METKTASPATALAPTVGRIVHFYPRAPNSGDDRTIPAEHPEAALVVFADGTNVVTLDVVDYDGRHRCERGVAMGEFAGQWRWPPRA